MRFQILSVVISCSLTILTSCQDNRSESAAIIGEDNRQLTKANHKSLGYVKADGNICTGFLTKNDEVTTAGHCLREIDDLNAISFVHRGQSYETVQVRYNELLDIARISLEKSVEGGVALNSSEPDFSQAITVVGIDAQNPARHFSSKSTQQHPLEGRPGFLSYDADTLPGISGAPLLQEGKVVGVHLGSSLDKKMNYAAIIDFHADEGERPAMIVEACAINNLRGCVEEVVGAVGCSIGAVASPLLMASFSSHRDYMISQSQALKVPACLKNVIAANFGFSKDYPRLRFGSANVVAPDAVMTMGEYVFWPTGYEPNFLDPDDLYEFQTLLHELEHVKQYRSKTVPVFLAEYSCDTGRNIGRGDQLAIHDSLKIEQAATAKAASLMKKAMQDCKLLSRPNRKEYNSFDSPVVLRRGDTIKSANGEYLVALETGGSSLYGIKLNEPNRGRVWGIEFPRMAQKLLFYSNRLVVLDVEDVILYQSIEVPISGKYRLAVSDSSGGLLLQEQKTFNLGSGPELVWNDSILVKSSNDAVGTLLTGYAGGNAVNRPKRKRDGVIAVGRACSAEEFPLGSRCFPHEGGRCEQYNNLGAVACLNDIDTLSCAYSDETRRCFDDSITQSENLFGDYVTGQVKQSHFFVYRNDSIGANLGVDQAKQLVKGKTSLAEGSQTKVKLEDGQMLTIGFFDAISDKHVTFELWLENDTFVGDYIRNEAGASATSGDWVTIEVDQETTAKSINGSEIVIKLKNLGSNEILVSVL